MAGNMDLPPKLDLTGMIGRNLGSKANDSGKAQENVSLSPKPSLQNGDTPASATTSRIVLPESGKQVIPTEKNLEVDKDTSAAPVLEKSEPAKAAKARPLTMPLKPVRPVVAGSQDDSTGAVVSGHQPDAKSQARPNSGGRTPTMVLKPVQPRVPVAAQPAQDSGGPSARDAVPAVERSGQDDTPRIASKKETSKIPLDLALATTPSQNIPRNAPKTIKISPVKPVPSITGKIPLVAATQSQDSGQSDKRKTSKISLDAVLVPDQEAGQETKELPRTIKLKKPAPLGTVSIKDRGGNEQAVKEQSPDDIASVKPVVSQTAVIPEQQPEPGGDVESPTRRKTIKVKKPSQQASIRVANGGVAAGAAAEPSGAGAFRPAVAQAPLQMEPQERTHWIFPLIAVASIIVIFLAIYVFAAQAFGPNVSLTQLSYAPSGPNLFWPGKILRGM